MEKHHGASPKNREMKWKTGRINTPLKAFSSQSLKCLSLREPLFVRLFFKYSSVFFILSFGEGKDRQRSYRSDRNLLGWPLSQRAKEGGMFLG